MRLPRRLLTLIALGAAAWYTRNVFRFRDPMRVPPPQVAAVLSPADGRITFVRRIEDGRVRTEGLTSPLEARDLTGMEVGEGWLLGLLMGPLDVRYVYAPTSGRARTVYLGGDPARGTPAGLGAAARLLFGRPADPPGTPGRAGNERHTTVLSSERGGIGVTLVSGAAGLKAVTYTRAGAEVRAGHKLALLEGSGLVLLTLPGNALPQVSVGDRVTGAATVVARFD